MNKIYIIVEGGLVQNVFADTLCDVILIDRDNDEWDEERDREINELGTQLQNDIEDCLVFEVY